MHFTPATLRHHLVNRASRLYRQAGRFAYHFARGKLGGDPMFLAMLERGLIPDQARILDLGCGQGLLAAWLLVARQQYERAPGRTTGLHLGGPPIFAASTC